jgi:hypothetical protein
MQCKDFIPKTIILWSDRHAVVRKWYLWTATPFFNVYNVHYLYLDRHEWINCIQYTENKYDFMILLCMQIFATNKIANICP